MAVKPNPKKAKDIGRRIVQARNEAGGMTQRELAELIGVTPRSVAAYEAGDVIPYRFLRAIEDATGRSAAWLLHGDEAQQLGGVDMEEVMSLLREIREEVRQLRR